MKKKLEKTLISIYKKKGYDGLASYLDSNVDWYIYDVLEGNTLDDKATVLVNKWKQEEKQKLDEGVANDIKNSLHDIEENLKLKFMFLNSDGTKLARFIAKKLSDEQWNTLQTKHKGSSYAKANSLMHMWVKSGELGWEGQPCKPDNIEKQTLSEIKDMGWEPKVVLPKHYYDVTEFPPLNYNSSPFTTSVDMMLYPDREEKSKLLESTDKRVEEDSLFTEQERKKVTDFIDNFELEEQIEKDQLKFANLVMDSSRENKGNRILNSLEHKGLRFNSGKIRYDLVQPWAHEQMVKVLTKGAEKYAERNWERGMAWSNVLASLERHLQAIKKGEDYDPETGELHAAHLACNAHFLTAYYKIYPQGDDRPHSYLSPLKVGLDIDDVLADFVGKWRERYVGRPINFWNFDKDMKDKFAEVAQDKEFWMSMKPKISPDELPFEPTCYITSRMIPNEWTEEWLQANGFPAVPVHTIGFNESKVAVAKESGIDIFVDDRYENFVELNNAGICTFLMDSPHNQRYQVGAKRIFNLKELM